MTVSVREKPLMNSHHLIHRVATTSNKNNHQLGRGGIHNWLGLQAKGDGMPSGAGGITRDLIKKPATGIRQREG